MPENPAGLGYKPEIAVHFSKKPSAPYERYYFSLKNQLGWTATGIWHISCQMEVYVNGDSELCGCGVSDIDLAKGLKSQEVTPAITKLI